MDKVAGSGNDEFYTPSYSIKPILKYLKKNSTIWCPFDTENSEYVKLFRESGHKVIATHIWQGQDFFNYEPEEYDCIISNPPFSIKDKVLNRLYSFHKPFAVLLPLNSLQGKSRFKYFKQGIQILIFDSRVCYHDQKHMNSVVKGSPFATAYFCKDLLPKDLIIEQLHEYDRPL